MSKDLNPEKALIFRISHRDNVSWILDNGLHCRTSNIFDPNYINIGNTELIDARSRHPVPCAPGGTLSDYVPFYFTPFSPMLYNIKTGWGDIRKRSNGEIVIFVSSLNMLSEKNCPFLFTDRHAYLASAQFYADLTDLDQIDWSILQNRDFRRDSDDPGKVERYQAEALAYKHLPIDTLLGMVCYNDSVASDLETQLKQRELKIPVATKPGWYF